MITKQKIKKLAEIVSQSPLVQKDIEEYVLTNMSKHELKEFLRYLRIELNKRQLGVVSSEPLSKDSLELLKKSYKGREIIEDLDPTLGAGIKIKDNDLVIDFSFKKFVDDTIETIKN